MGQARNDKPLNSERALTPFWRSPERALFISSALVTICWLGHFFFLLLVDPLKYLALSKETAVAYASVPLCVGIVFLLWAIYNFSKIESRSFLHFVLLIFALIFGSLSIQGLIGSVMYLMRRSSGV